MKNLIYKEFTLATPLLTFLFLGFSVMAFIPGYPILCGAFFVCFGIFQGYQYSRESEDITYSVLLPVKKTDVVKAKFIAAILVQMVAFALLTIFTLIRMTFLSDAVVYVQNALMGANLVFLGLVLLIFAIFNWVFIGGFFKTAYKYGKPFVSFIVLCFLVIIVAEALHHFPGMGWMNTLDYSNLDLQMTVLLCAGGVYVAVTILSCRVSQKRFEKIDL